MKIKNLKINGVTALAPMAGVTDKAYREICKKFGVSYVISEMISAKGLIYKNENTLKLMEISESERPIGIQFFGNEPNIMAKACEIAEKINPDVIDVNMGCPVPKVVNNGCGSALMKNPELCYKIISSMVNSTSIPITVKIRKGWDKNHENAIEIAMACEEAGASAITIHGRTKSQMYSLTADWQIIKDIKSAVNIPVIGNGDILSACDAVDMLNKTNCDMIMVGRGSLGNPWIFKEINEKIYFGNELNPPSIIEKIDVMLEHISNLCKYKGEFHGMKEARKYVSWYIKGLKCAAKFRNEAGKLNSFNELLDLSRRLIKENKN